MNNNSQIIENNQKNLYLRGFHSNLYFRPSCYNCKFANPNRISDITIADCWGVDKLKPQWDVHNGISLVIINTVRGKNVYNKLENYDKIDLDLDFVLSENAQFREPAKSNKKRQYFFDNLDNLEFDKLINTCVPSKKIKKILIKIIPSKMKKVIKKLIKN